MKKKLVVIRIVIIFIITLFNFVAHAQENRQSALDKVIEQMNAQNNKLQDTKSIFKSELIPAIEQELKKNNSRFDKFAKDRTAQSDLTNDKLSRLVDILKSVVIEQDKSHKEILTNQKKIMEFLIKISNKPDNHKFFFKSLEGLSLDDYRNLNVLIIRNNDISVSERQKYIQVLRLFKKHLVERFDQGEDKYREMDLKTLLDYITF